MKRVIFFLAVVLVSLVGVVTAPLAGAQRVNDFMIRSFEADYYLDKDAEGRSTLKTIEKITAIFPSSDQNHGIERAIPTKYDGHSTSLDVQSVTDGKGAPLNYMTSMSNDNNVLRIGDPDKYVHGQQEYVITYTQRDVTRFFADTNDDEFYWDVNGTEWSQPMETVSARLHVAPSVASALTGQTSCYQGVAGSTDGCTITKDISEKETTFITNVDGLNPFENVTIAVGFKPHTFAAYQPTAEERLFAFALGVWFVVLTIGSLVAVGLLVWMSIWRHKIMNRVKGRGTIVPEYLPPKETNVLVAAQVLKNAKSDMTAQLIDLAVRHYIKIYQTKDKSIFTPAEYELEIAKSTKDLQAEELELLQNLFQDEDPKIGSRFAMKDLQSSHEIRKKIFAAQKKLLDDSRKKYGLFERAEPQARAFRLVGIFTIIFGVLTLSPLLIIAAIFAFAFAYMLWPLTEKGMTLREYLEGLNLYITVAEEERLKMLQSPEGAEKVGVTVDGKDSKQLVKLYERVLPYAILFGVEKEWAKQLGAYYEASKVQPDWYTGTTAFNAAAFGTALSGFSSVGTATSSSSGGSGGGGSSGGGGGGGGGGGW